MPLIIVLFIGILAFGVFDFILDRPLPVVARQHSVQQTLNSPLENVNLPSIPVVAASETARCERHDTACQLVALYRFVLTTITPEARRSLWLHTQQHPARTLFMQRGDAVDIAILFSSLLDRGTFVTMWSCFQTPAMFWRATFHHPRYTMQAGVGRSQHRHSIRPTSLPPITQPERLAQNGSTPTR
jgi:hypothetical protein